MENSKLVELIECAKLIVRILSANVAQANIEYMRGDLPSGAFEYILRREALFHAAIDTIDEHRELKQEFNIGGITDEICKAISSGCMDAQGYVENDIENTNDAAIVLGNIDKINKFLSEFGYIDTHPIFGFKVKSNVY